MIQISPTSLKTTIKMETLYQGQLQTRTQSNACSRVRLALALGRRNELRMVSYALT